MVLALVLIASSAFAERQEFSRKIFIASMSEFSWSKYRLYYQGDIESTELQIKELKRNSKGQVTIYKI